MWWWLGVSAGWIACPLELLPVSQSPRGIEPASRARLSLAGLRPPPPSPSTPTLLPFSPYLSPPAPTPSLPSPFSTSARLPLHPHPLPPLPSMSGGQGGKPDLSGYNYGQMSSLVIQTGQSTGSLPLLAALLARLFLGRRRLARSCLPSPHATRLAPLPLLSPSSLQASCIRSRVSGAQYGNPSAGWPL